MPASGGYVATGVMSYPVNAGGEAGNGGADLAAGVSLSLLLDNNFKIKAFADFESFSLSSSRPWMNSVVLGWSSAWFW